MRRSSWRRSSAPGSRAGSSTGCSTGSTKRRARRPERPVRYAVLSDIHGNLEALEAVLGDATPRADAVLCLGDIVGYGADPAACVERVAERAQAITAGNHEHGGAGRLGPHWVQPYAPGAGEGAA